MSQQLLGLIPSIAYIMWERGMHFSKGAKCLVWCLWYFKVDLNTFNLNFELIHE